MTAPLTQLVHPSWRVVFEPHTKTLARIGDRIREESARGIVHHPSRDTILRAFQVPLESVRVVIVGQDPYPTPGHAIGLAFAVDTSVRPLPRSLTNIYTELETDLGIPRAEHGDLSNWVSSGVMLLNRVLTVQSGHPGSHRGIGWEEITASVIEALAHRGSPLVAVLWGRDAQTIEPLLGGVPIIASAHPSPLSARNGFFGSRPFSRVNEVLADQGSPAVDWRV